jgi:hypothetical protein
LLVRKGKAAGLTIFTLAVIFLFIGVAMPYYKSPQRLEGNGPKVTFTASLPYWISSYLIPPVDKGQPMSLSLQSSKVGSTSVLLSPYDENTQTIVGPPLVNVVFPSYQKALVVFTNASRSGPYLLVITSYNSTYAFYFTSVWSPFYPFRTLTIYGIALLPFGVIILYYDQIVERREKMAQQALRGIKERQMI